MSNLPTYNLNAASVTARNAEYAGTPLTDDEGSNTYADPVLGCNKAGSNAPGIGIATGNIAPKVQDWSVLDQAGAARTPQDSQHIGGDGLGEGDASNNPINVIQGADINDTVSLIAAVVQGADDAGYNTAGADPVNRSGETVEIGENLWGTNSVA